MRQSKAHSDKIKRKEGRKKRKKKKFRLDRFPDEILVAIIEFLRPREILNLLGMVNRKMHMVCVSNVVWQRVFLREYRTHALQTLAFIKDNNEFPPDLSTDSWMFAYRLIKGDGKYLHKAFSANAEDLINMMIHEGIIPASTNGVADVLAFVYEECTYKVGLYLRVFGYKEGLPFIGDKTDDWEIDHEKYVQQTQHSALSHAFLRRLNFKNMNLLQGLRKMIKFVPFPQTTQLMKSLLSVFSRTYLKDNANLDANKAADGMFPFDENQVYGLSYALIMLNTDIHNSMVSTKMKKAFFVDMMMESPIFESNTPESMSIIKKILEQFYQDICAKEMLRYTHLILQSTALVRTGAKIFGRGKRCPVELRDGRIVVLSPNTSKSSDSKCTRSFNVNIRVRYALRQKKRSTTLCFTGTYDCEGTEFTFAEKEEAQRWVSELDAMLKNEIYLTARALNVSNEKIQQNMEIMQ